MLPSVQEHVVEEQMMTLDAKNKTNKNNQALREVNKLLSTVTSVDRFKPRQPNLKNFQSADGHEDSEIHIASESSPKNNNSNSMPKQNSIYGLNSSNNASHEHLIKGIKNKKSESTFKLDQGSLRSKFSMNRKLRGSVDTNLSKANQKQVVQTLMNHFFESDQYGMQQTSVQSYSRTSLPALDKRLASQGGSNYPLR